MPRIIPGKLAIENLKALASGHQPTLDFLTDMFHAIPEYGITSFCAYLEVLDKYHIYGASIFNISVKTGSVQEFILLLHMVVKGTVTPEELYKLANESDFVIPKDRFVANVKSIAGVNAKELPKFFAKTIKVPDRDFTVDDVLEWVVEHKAMLRDSYKAIKSIETDAYDDFKELCHMAPEPFSSGIWAGWIWLHAALIKLGANEQQTGIARSRFISAIKDRQMTEIVPKMANDFRNGIDKFAPGKELSEALNALKEMIPDLEEPE